MIKISSAESQVMEALWRAGALTPEDVATLKALIAEIDDDRR